jgi:hypothetical protein
LAFLGWTDPATRVCDKLRMKPDLTGKHEADEKHEKGISNLECLF